MIHYEDIRNAIIKYSNKKEICRYILGVPAEEIRNTVIIAPSWEPDSIENIGYYNCITKYNPLFTSCKVWDIEYEDLAFTYIKTGFSASLLMDAFLSLAETECQRVIFIGSVGALNKEYNIGDLIIPKAAICGDGASRYIAYANMRDVFGEIVSPCSNFTRKAFAVACKYMPVQSIHIGCTFSSDSIVAQYVHLTQIINMQCDSIDMESAVAFRCGTLLNIPTVALLVVSDSAINNQSLIKDRLQDDEMNRKYVKKQILPKIIHDLIKI